MGAVVLAIGCRAAHSRREVAQVEGLLAERGAADLGWQSNGEEVDEAVVRGWVAEPMTAERAVRVAMLRSPRLQLEYARLGIARADVLEAVEIGNPQLSVAWLTPVDGSGAGSGGEVTAGVSMSLVDLLMIPARLRVATSGYGRAKGQLAVVVLGVVADVQAAWYRSVGARQVADMRAAVADAMAASAELAQRFYEAGNISELELAREQAAATEASIEGARAAGEAASSRLELDSALGLTGEEVGWPTSDQLPLPVLDEDDPAELARMARESNLALAAARQEVEILEDRLGIRRTFGWLGDTEVGYGRELEDGVQSHGPTATVDVPLFNQGRAEVMRAEAELAAARASVLELELSTDSGVRVGAERVRVASEIVRLHRDGLIPQRQTVVARSQQEQNYMLIGVFELLQAKAQEYDAWQSYLESVRDYWLARVELARVVGAALPSEARVEAPTPATEAIVPSPPVPPGGM